MLSCNLELSFVLVHILVLVVELWCHERYGLQQVQLSWNDFLWATGSQFRVVTLLYPSCFLNSKFCHFQVLCCLCVNIPQLQIVHELFVPRMYIVGNCNVVV